MDPAHDITQVARKGRYLLPAFPAATQTLRPGTAMHVSIQREMAAVPSWAWPFVPRLMLIEMGILSSSATASR